MKSTNFFIFFSEITFFFLLPFLTLAQTQSHVTNVSTFGGNDGAIDVIVHGGTSPYSYLWSNGEVSEDLSGLTSGTYTVTISDSHNCNHTVSFNVLQPNQSSSSSPSAEVFVYPNPTQGKFRIYFHPEDHTNLSVNILNLNGEVIQSESYQNLKGAYIKDFDLTSQATGVYFLRIKTDKAIIIKKMIYNNE